MNIIFLAVNACDRELNICDSNAICTPFDETGVTSLKVSCECPEGYVGNGLNATKSKTAFCNIWLLSATVIALPTTGEIRLKEREQLWCLTTRQKHSVLSENSCGSELTSVKKQLTNNEKSPEFVEIVLKDHRNLWE